MLHPPVRFSRCPFSIIIRPPPIPTLFPYTTLFRSNPPPTPAPHPTEATPPPTDSHEHSTAQDRKSTRLNSSHVAISYAVFCLKKKNHADGHIRQLDNRGATAEMHATNEHRADHNSR